MTQHILDGYNAFWSMFFDPAAYERWFWIAGWLGAMGTMAGVLTLLLAVIGAGLRSAYNRVNRE